MSLSRMCRMCPAHFSGTFGTRLRMCRVCRAPLRERHIRHIGVRAGHVLREQESTGVRASWPASRSASGGNRCRRVDLAGWGLRAARGRLSGFAASTRAVDYARNFDVHTCSPRSHPRGLTYLGTATSEGRGLSKPDLRAVLARTKSREQNSIFAASRARETAAP